MNTNRGTAVAATCLLLAIASQSTALAQTATKSAKAAPAKVPAPVPVAPASGVVSTSGATSVQPPAPVVSQPSAQVAAQPGAQPVVQPAQGSVATAPGTQGSPVGTSQPAARPAVVSGPPPVVVGPSGRSNGGVSGVRISIGGVRPVVNREKPVARSMHVGLSTTGDSPLVANASVALDTSANEPRSIFQIPMGRAGSASLAATGSEGSGVHTWTRDGSTFSTAALGDSGVGQPSSVASGSTLVGSSLKTANQRPGVPFGVVNEMLTRMGGMGSVMSSRTAGVSPE